MLPMMLLLIERSRLSSSAPPTTTRTVPARISSPMRKFSQWVNRLRTAMLISTPSRASMSVQLPGLRQRLGGLHPIEDPPVGEPDDRVRVAHHLRVMRGEDEGGAVSPIHLL